MYTQKINLDVVIRDGVKDKDQFYLRIKNRRRCPAKAKFQISGLNLE